MDINNAISRFVEQINYSAQNCVNRSYRVDMDVKTAENMLNHIADLEHRLAEAEEKNTELEKDLFVLSSDVIYCGCGHVSAGLQEKAKRIYGKLRESGGEVSKWTSV